MIDVHTNDVVASFRSAADVTKNRVLLESVGQFAGKRSAAEVYEVALSVCDGLFHTRSIEQLRLGDYSALATAVAKELRR
ncbi:hypothetical protein [Mycobacterium sp. 94-17]|uniref:hypothetical protein n=1 Tax=Mycobacterium sp. 94-17 TaxID=2986147 RepID=UPI002D1F6DA9|nr:hypothetical protein [Mycobacterium sp. 94-17]MEB4210973.1 hypothetical protein [Mycobacterium sp. 94-17]